MYAHVILAVTIAGPAMGGASEPRFTEYPAVLPLPSDFLNIIVLLYIYTTIVNYFYKAINGQMAEWSKALRLGSF
ncbi:hypothetical protein PtrM4_007340 [Pyrenophora tritici-repentis]|uniref:Uncharacterized protein n=1 Tax=Pyrenophora tritici-repentis TaxID=45151 RepID=A0A834S6M5_9PLEO|nr:hypothetical protein PtrM4_007340 [Pyrenophora tritici-repentis]